MPLTRHERKDRLGHGGLREVAAKVPCSEPLVSLVVNDKAADTKLTRRVKVAVARKIGMPVAEVFGEGASVQKVG